MRLCILTTSYPRSNSDPAGIFVKRSIDALGERGHGGTVVVPLDGTEPQEEQQSAFIIRRFRYGILRRGRLAFGMGMLPNIRSRPSLFLQSPALLIQLTRYCLRYGRRADAVLANWLISGLAAWLAKRLGGMPYAVVVRGEDARLLKVPVLSSLLKSSLRHAFAVIGVSSGIVEQLRKIGIPEERLHLIPNGVGARRVEGDRIEQGRRKYSIPKEESVLLFVGRVIPLKRVEVLVRLLSKLDSKYHLYVAGPCEDVRYLEQLNSLALETGLSGRVHFLGSVAPDDVPILLSLADLFLSASSYEGRPNAVLEALSAGTPVLLSDIPAHRALVENGNNGCLFSPDELSSAKAQVELLAGRSEQGHGVSKSGLWSWEDCAKSYEEILQRSLHR